MDTLTLQFICTWAMVFASCGVVAYACQRLETYIKNNITNKK